MVRGHSGGAISQQRGPVPRLANVGKVQPQSPCRRSISAAAEAKLIAIVVGHAEIFYEIVQVPEYPIYEPLERILFVAQRLAPIEPPL